MGGIEVLVPERMRYTDVTQGLEINLRPGHQLLNGEQAEHFVRFRQDLHGDIGRVQRQQMALQALRQRLSTPAVLPRLPKIIEVMRSHIDTNLTVEEMMAIATYGLKLDAEQVNLVMLPGRASEPWEFAASYWLMDQAERDRLLARHFDQAPLIAHSRALSGEIADVSPRRLLIAIQNATEDPRLAEDLVAHLQDQGFTNTYLSNQWPQILETTEIVVQRGDREAAERLQNAMGLGRIDASSTGDLESDLTIRVGRDWQADF
ncbi:MAG: LCP family protein [Thermostichales cyanobacterium SZTDM-1c_bins_54]